MQRRLARDHNHRHCRVLRNADARHTVHKTGTASDYRDAWLAGRARPAFRHMDRARLMPCSDDVDLFECQCTENAVGLIRAQAKHAPYPQLLECSRELGGSRCSEIDSHDFSFSLCVE